MPFFHFALRQHNTTKKYIYAMKRKHQFGSQKFAVLYGENKKGALILFS
jgi:hypothetical protein